MPNADENDMSVFQPSQNKASKPMSNVKTAHKKYAENGSSYSEQRVTISAARLVFLHLY